VTGAAGGIGYETALALATGCVDVIVAGPDSARGREALSKIRPLAPQSLVRFEVLDLASLDSVAAFANRLAAENRPLDLLINNAEVKPRSARQVTADGFEMQFASNYLGHFALTGLLLPLLLRSRGARVVQVSSLAHRFGDIHFDDLNGERGYRPWVAYSQSKLASLLFAFELQRQSDAHRWGLMSSAAHPGYTEQEPAPDSLGAGGLLSRLRRPLGTLAGHSAAKGALPVLFAATSDDARPGRYYGPGGFLELAGPPSPAYIAGQARDQEAGRRLWQISEQLTGVRWPVS
jgi:NAD(P)-dependent dehydrogenase (short-subunit alcohol dehydrogenase family)